MKKEYYLGLDMGTNSVGWAVTDKEYNLLKFKGQDMWGIREFEEASTSADRRQHRVSRRSRQREQVRIGLLKGIFEEAVFAEDPLFYVRMDNSFYQFAEGDKDERLTSAYALFSDSDYTDVNYYKDYPTIFHLRKKLICDDVEKDSKYARKVFLATLSYFKRRGHFLNEGLSGESSGKTDIIKLIDSLSCLLEEQYNISLNYDINRKNEICDAFKNSELSRSKKVEILSDVFDVKNETEKETKNKKVAILKAIVGLKIDFVKAFDIVADGKAEIEFSSSGFEDKLPEIYSVIGVEYSELIETLRTIYDAGILSAVMDGVEWLSEARVASYEKHKSDLSLLKKCIRKYCGLAEYDYLFRGCDVGSYSVYTGSVNSEGKKIRRGQNMDNSKSGERYENLCKRIKKDLEDYKEDSDVAYIFDEIALERFLPKQLTFANGVIPNQLHERELRQILKNASKTLSFLNNIDESGYSVSEKIIQLFTFRVPYFIGPTSQKYKGNGWAIRKAGKENEKVYPWNIQDVFDYPLSNQTFIERMVRRCSYIAGERALPKESMEYQAFVVLNAINCIKIKNVKISVKEKQDIYNDLFSKGNRVTKNKIVNYFKQRGRDVEDVDITGIDGMGDNIGGTLSTYKRFLGIFGEDIRKDPVKKIIEDIVFLGTVYGDSKAMFKELLLEKYSKMLDEDQIKRICGFKFRDWGNLSKEFLELQGVNKDTGEIMSLIRAMWEDNLTLTELINSEQYSFKQALEEKKTNQLKTLSEFTFEDLQDTYYSAPVKRMIWQTLQIIKEIERIMGKSPERLFVEMTRSDSEVKGDAGRKDSRAKELIELYKAIKEDNSWAEEIEKAESNGSLRSKKLYLYYKQKGKDMYTGKPIDLDDLFNDNLYDIDHIYPRHYVKDDSIHNNLVLVDKRKNSRKSDVYPIDSEIRNNPEVKKLWEMLHKQHFINDEKYRRLTGNSPFSEEECADFIARQMVETGQATKGVNGLLKELLGTNTTIVYSKAKNVSDFRRDFDFLKSRTVNDFHHANDAYLNIVVGNAYYTKFTANPLNFVKREKKDYHLGNLFRHNIIRDGYEAWSAPVWSDDKRTIIDDGKTLSTVKKMMSRNTPILTRLAIIQKGELSDANIVAASRVKGSGYLPIKGKSSALLKCDKYGGYNNIKNAYFFVVEHEIPGKGVKKNTLVKTRTIECMPVYMVSYVEKQKEGLLDYCKDIGLINPRIILKKLRPQSLIKVNGFPVYITGKTGNRYVLRNACNLVLGKKYKDYIHEIEKYNTKKILSSNITEAMNADLYQQLMNKHSVGIFSNKPNPIGSTLIEGEAKFKKLTLLEQIYVLTQILQISLICNSSLADLRLIGGSGQTGVTAISKTIDSQDKVIYMAQSVTGLYNKEIDLKNI